MRNRCKRMNGGQKSVFDNTKKHDAIQKQNCGINDRNEWEYTHNKSTFPRASVLWQNRNEGGKLF